MGCCRHDCAEIFDEKFARKTAKRYAKKGLDKTAQKIAVYAASVPFEDASVVEVGGGVGALQLELLKRGAARGTIVELVEAYRPVAEHLAREAGVADRSEFKVADLVAEPNKREPADVVVMHRVVCCTRDGVRLAGITGELARRALVFSYPRPSRLMYAFARVINLWQRIRRREFRFYVHAPEALVAAASEAGLSLVGSSSGRVWEVAALRRVDT